MIVSDLIIPFIIYLITELCNYTETVRFFLAFMVKLEFRVNK